MDAVKIFADLAHFHTKFTFWQNSSSFPAKAGSALNTYACNNFFIDANEL
jgi:hypothetical protein